MVIGKLTGCGNIPPFHTDSFLCSRKWNRPAVDNMMISYGAIEKNECEISCFFIFPGEIKRKAGKIKEKDYVKSAGSMGREEGGSCQIPSTFRSLFLCDFQKFQILPAVQNIIPWDGHWFFPGLHHDDLFGGCIHDIRNREIQPLGYISASDEVHSSRKICIAGAVVEYAGCFCF